MSISTRITITNEQYEEIVKCGIESNTSKEVLIVCFLSWGSKHYDEFKKFFTPEGKNMYCDVSLSRSVAHEFFRTLYQNPKEDPSVVCKKIIQCGLVLYKISIGEVEDVHGMSYVGEI